MLFASIAIAAAIAFCSTNEGRHEPRCSAAPVVAVELTNAHRATLRDLARDMHLGLEGEPLARFRADRIDYWQVTRPGSRGDCEDLVLGAAAELVRRHPELIDSYRFVALEEGRARIGGRRALLTHLVLVIEGVGGERIVLDTLHRVPRRLEAYGETAAWTARAGMGGRWMPYAAGEASSPGGQ